MDWAQYSEYNLSFGPIPNLVYLMAHKQRPIFNHSDRNTDFNRAAIERTFNFLHLTPSDVYMFPPFFWIIYYFLANIRNNTVKKLNKAIINVQVWDLPLLMQTIAKFPCSKDQFITNMHYGSKVQLCLICAYFSPDSKKLSFYWRN